MAGQLWARWPCKEQKSDLAARYRDGPCQTATVPCPLQLKRLLAPSTPIRLAPGLQSFTSFFPFPLFLLLPASSLVGLVTLSLRFGPLPDLPFSLPIYHSFIGINSLAQPPGTGSDYARLFDDATRPTSGPLRSDEGSRAHSPILHLLDARLRTARSTSREQLAF